jgi:hypothetical protein
MTAASEHAESACLDARAKNLMDAVACHDIGRAAKNPCSACLHVHQVEKPKFPFLIIEEQVHVGSVAGLAAGGRAEQVKLLHAELLQLGLMLLKLGYGLIAFHATAVAEFR